MGNILLENPDIETRWYFKYFLGNTHKNYLIMLPGEETIVPESALLSVLHIPGDENVSVRAILWRQSGSERLLTRGAKGGRGIDLKKVVSEFGHGAAEKRVTEVKDPSMQQQLLVLEEQEGFVHCKFGVLYAKAGQLTDDDMFSNAQASPGFEKFYRALGSVHEQLGFSGFRGGLDTASGTTGEHMVHTTEFGKEIVFHVSTLLPFDEKNRQQLERKRHVGNDMAVIVYQEDPETEFDPGCIKSQYTHIYARVSPLPNGEFKLAIYTKNTVPEYGPPLPNPAIFKDLEELRHFLLVKLLNGEKSTLRSPTSSFAVKKSRTLLALITSIHNDQSRKSTLPRGSPSRAKMVEDFRQKGQSIKMTKIAAGKAPTSMRTSTLARAAAPAGEEPWTPICITSNLAEPIICGGAWGADFVGSGPSGLQLYYVEAHESGKLQTRLLIDSSIAIVQISIDEGPGMMYLRSSGSLDDIDDHGKNGQVYAVPLEMVMHREDPINKKALKKFAVVNSKGSSVFSISTSAVNTAVMLQKTCKLAIASGKKIRTYHFIPTNPAGVPGMGAGGQLIQLQEFQCQDHIGNIALAGMGVTQGAPQYMCCSLRSGEFVLINLDSSATTTLALSARAAVNPVMCLQVPDPIDDSQSEFVLCYNKSVEFKHANGRDSRQYKVSFSARPFAISYVYPYLLGFTADSIEVVTMINGSLVKTLQLARCKYLGNKNGVFFSSASGGTISLFKMSADALSGKTSVDREAGGAAPVAKGNVFVRRMSSSTAASLTVSGLRNLQPDGNSGEGVSPRNGRSPRGSPRISPVPSPAASPGQSPIGSPFTSSRFRQSKKKQAAAAAAKEAKVAKNASAPQGTLERKRSGMYLPSHS